MSDDDVRVRADERRRMLGELELERNQLYRNIETCRIRDIDGPFIGDWSLKDIVGPVVAWEAEFTSALKDLREGGGHGWPTSTQRRARRSTMRTRLLAGKPPSGPCSISSTRPVRRSSMSWETSPTKN